MCIKGIRNSHHYKQTLSSSEMCRTSRILIGLCPEIWVNKNPAVVWYYEMIFVRQMIWLTRQNFQWEKFLMTALIWDKNSSTVYNLMQAFSKPCTLTHWGRERMAAISQTTFSNAFSWKKIYEFRLKLHWSLFPRVQLTIFQYWSR